LTLLLRRSYQRFALYLAKPSFISQVDPRNRVWSHCLPSLFYEAPNMSSRTFPFADDHPTKRSRINGDSLDNQISSLNESAVLKLQYGRIDDAQHFFVQALDCYTAKRHELKIQGNDINGRNCPYEPSTLTYHVGGQSTPHFCTLKSPSLNDALEYDEGVRIYSDTMVFQTGDGESMQSATLYYNIAQSFVLMQKYDEARSWFELALMCMKHVPLHDNVAVAMVKIRHNLGYCYYHLAKSLEAKHCFEKALELSEKFLLGLPYTAVARTAYAVVNFYNASPNDKALIDLLEHSLAEYKCLFEKGSREVAAVLNNIGRAYFAEGKFKKALQYYNESLSIRRMILNESSIDIAATICSTGQTHHRLGELTEALQLYEEFLGLATSVKYNKRDVAIIAKSTGEIYHKNGDLKQARSHFENALAAAVAGFGHFHAEVASIYNRLGNLFYETNDLNNALECYKEGLIIEQLTLPPGHARIVVTIANIAQIHYQLGEYALAFARYNQVYMIQLKVHGPQSLEVAKALATMGEMEYKMRNFEAAFALFQDVLVIQREFYKEIGDGLDVASTLNSIGIVACAQGEYKVAQSCFDSSLSIRRNELGDHKDTATLWYNLATVKEETGDEDNAIAMYKECFRIERLMLSSGLKCDLVDTLQRLGRLHQRRGELDEALQYFQEALSSLRNRGEEATLSVAKFLNLVGNVHLQRADISQMMQCYIEASRIYQESNHGAPPNEMLVIAGYYLYGLSKLHPLSAAVA
jgi:tetratricopeptide (TPR) repeat protein